MNIRTSKIIAGAFLLLVLGSVSDARAQEWREEVPLPHALYSMAAVAAEGRLYVAGGRTGRGAVSDALLSYDVDREMWRDDLPGMDDKRYFAAAAVLDGKIYVIGGRDQDDDVLGSVEVFDLRTRSWNDAGDLEEERYGHAAVVLDGVLYVLGGANEDGNVLATVEVYDAEDDSWSISERWKLDQPRTAFATVAIGRTAYSFGGINRVPLPQVQYFAIEDGAGVLVPPGLLEARAFVGAVAVGDSIYIIGGRNAGNRALDDVVLFIPSEGPMRQWQRAPRLQNARDSFGAVEVDGKVFVIGGRDGDDRTLSSVESFNSRSRVATERPRETGFELEQNHPNPFTTSTRISFMIGDAAEHVDVSIYDLRGRLLHKLAEGYLAPGRHVVEWDGSTGGRVAPSGVYVYVLKHGGSERTRVMTKIR